MDWVRRRGRRPAGGHDRQVHQEHRAPLIERHPHPTDRRAQRIYLTDAGRNRLAAAGPTVRGVEDRLAAGFTPEQLGVVSAWLIRMAAASTGGEEYSTL